MGGVSEGSLKSISKFCIVEQNTEYTEDGIKRVHGYFFSENDAKIYMLDNNLSFDNTELHEIIKP